MNRLLKPLSLTLGLLAVSAALALAHDLFIKMDSYHLPSEAPVRVPIINGTFQLSENSIAENRVADISVVAEGQRSHPSMDHWEASGDTTFLELRTGGPGTYLLGVSTLPNDLGMDASDFNLYLASDGVVDVLKQRALDGELNEGAWERYSKHVKAVFQVGEQRSDGWDTVLGYPAELVPLSNPYETTVGDELAFRVLVAGEPVSGQLVIAGGDADGSVIEEREARSNGEGVVRFDLDRPGRWYAKFINMQKTSVEGLDYESRWATISFEIR